VSTAVEKMLLEEIRALREVLERIEALLEERLIGVEEPLPDEAEVIEEYEADKERGRVELVKLEDIRRRVLEALTMLRDYGFTPRLDIKKLRGYRNHYRLRIGEYRILFELEKPRKVIVYAILPRKQVAVQLS